MRVISLTPKGLERFAVAMPLWERAQARTDELLSLEDLRNVARKVRKAVRAAASGTSEQGLLQASSFCRTFSAHSFLGKRPPSSVAAIRPLVRRHPPRFVASSRASEPGAPILASASIPRGHGSPDTCICICTLRMPRAPGSASASNRYVRTNSMDEGRFEPRVEHATGYPSMRAGRAMPEAVRALS